MRKAARMSGATALDRDALNDLVTVLRQLGATVSIPSSVVDVMQGSHWGQRGQNHSGPWSPFEPISRAEMRVLHYLPTNLTLSEIASELYRSVDTVKTHARHLYTKLDAHSRSEAVRNARAAGLLV